MQSMKFPNSVMQRMMRICNKFFWGSIDKERKIHWASWDRSCKPIEERGVGCKKFQEMNKVYAMKMWWNFLKQDRLWAKFM